MKSKFCFILALIILLLNTVSINTFAYSTFDFDEPMSVISSVNDILSGGFIIECDGGCFAATGNGIYKNIYSSSVSTISDNNARCLSFSAPYLYYLNYENECTNICWLDTSDDYSEVAFTISGTADLLFIVGQDGNKYFLYMLDGVVYARNIDNLGNYAYIEAPSNDIDGFFPTESGIIFFSENFGKYELYNGTNTVKDINSFSINQGCIELSMDNGTYIWESDNSLHIKAESEYIYLDNLFANEYEDDILPYAQASKAESEDDILPDAWEYIKYAYDNTHYTSWQKNIIKNCRQMREMRWESPISCRFYGSLSENEDYYFLKKNMVYHGVPYHQDGNTGMYAGFNQSGRLYKAADAGYCDRNFKDFYESVRDEDSNFYLLDKNGKLKNTWGADCSSFLSYAWQVNRLTTSRFKEPEKIEVSEIKSNNATSLLSSFEVGDCLNSAGSHVIIIASIIKEKSFFRIVTWEYRCTTGSFMRNTQVYDSSIPYLQNNVFDNGYDKQAEVGKALPLGALVMRINRDGNSNKTPYKAYRYSKREKINYIPSKFVPLDNEPVSNEISILSTPRINVIDNGLFGEKKFTWFHARAKNDNYDIKIKDFGYELYFSEREQGTYTLIDTIESDDDVIKYFPDAIYGFYKIRAFAWEYTNENEYPTKIYSAFSKAAKVDKAQFIPQHIRAMKYDGSIYVSWNRSVNVSDYRVYLNGVEQDFSLDEYNADFAQIAFDISKLDSVSQVKVCALVEDEHGNVYEGPFAYIMIGEDGTVLGDCSTYHKGDVSSEDATIILRHIASLIDNNNNESFAFCADVDLDGSVSSSDATHILRFIAGLDGIVPISTQIRLNGQ